MFCREVDLACARLLSAPAPSSLVERLERLAPGWNSTAGTEECNRLFGVAMGIARDDFEGVLRWCKHTWLPARLLVLAAVTSSTEVRATAWRVSMLEYACCCGCSQVLTVGTGRGHVAHDAQTRPSGDIITLRKRCPWKGHLADIEQQLGVGPRTQFVLYPDGHSQW